MELPDQKYDVFLSFRGLDTRLNFVAHLHKALKDANIETFYDDEEIDTGIPLKPELEKAIITSRASVIVLSENYASSRWCLDELVLILKKRRNSNHIVIPIFYHVEPTHVRKQEQSFANAMAIHIGRMDAETNAEKKCQWAQNIQIWKEALTEVADLKGEDAKGRLETELISDIIAEVQNQVGVLLKMNLPDLTGMDHQVRFISSWLKDSSTHKADILTILGMGGIGKTSLAKFIYGQHYHQFQRSSFIVDINRKCGPEQSDKIRDLQWQIYSDISKRSSDQDKHVFDITSKIENALRERKVLIVLDDVGSPRQLSELLGKRGFYQGSKIIITTVNASLTKNFKLHSSFTEPKHTMLLLEGLDEDSSRNLFSFHCNGLKQGYEDVINKVLKYCQGHPKALEVLGTYLRDLSLAVWEEFIDLNITDPNPEMDYDIQTVLKRSFNLGSSNDKILFKHIALFFNGKDRIFSETILKACEIGTLNGIKNLIDRCLLTIGPRNELKMHQLLQYMGRYEVRQESSKSWKRSLLWCQEKSTFKDISNQRKGKGDLKGIVLDMRILEEKLGESPVFETDALSTMDNLMLLHLNYVKLNGSFEKFPERLKWLCMHGFYLSCIPPKLPMKHLVVLDMSYSNIKYFDMSDCDIPSPGKRRKLNESDSKDKRLLGSLKILNLSFCYQLQSVNGFIKLPALERLILAGCRSLTVICESIDECVELVLIDLSYCNMLKKLPKTLVNLNKLQALSLDGCNLVEFPIDMMERDLPQMTLANSQATSSTNDLPNVWKSFAISSPSSLVAVSHKDNNPSNESFPMEFSSLSASKVLKLDGEPIIFLPNCVRSVHRIELLNLEECDMLETNKQPPCTLRNLKFSRWDLLKKRVFDQGLTPLAIALTIYSLAHSSIGIEGIVRIQPITSVGEHVLRSLGWNDLHLETKQVETRKSLEIKISDVQLFYEFGIFSTFYGGIKIPSFIQNKLPDHESSIAFTVSSSTLKGLNFCYRLKGQDRDDGVNLLTVIVSNVTKNRTWIYKHYIHWVKVDEKCLIWLSHWMFGTNEMEDGDKVTITIPKEDISDNISIEEWGYSLIYEGGTVKQDTLCDYKLWNHRIGGDLSAFQLTTGEYLLDNHRFFWWHIDCPVYRSFIANGACYEETGRYYRSYPGGPDVVRSATEENTE